MKFLVVLCLVALAVADEDKNQEKKTQTTETTQNTNSGLTQPTGLLNNPVFPPFPSAVSNLAYTGLNGIQGVNPDFFTPTTTGTTGVVNGVPTFTRAVLPGTGVNPIQSAFQGVFPAVVNGISGQFPGLNTGLLSAVTGVPGITGGAIDPNTAANGAISSVTGGAYRFLTPEGLAGIPTQGYQTAQTVGLSGIPAFTGGVLPTFPNGVLQGQTVPTGILKNPSGGQTSGITNVPTISTGNISSGPLANVFRHA